MNHSDIQCCHNTSTIHISNGNYLCLLRENNLELEGSNVWLNYNCQWATNESLTTTSDNNIRTANDRLLLPKLSQLKVNNESDKENQLSDSFTTNNNPSLSSMSYEEVMDQGYRDLQADSGQYNTKYICASEFLSGFPDVSQI